jgi:Ca2+-transporting ATPase
LDFDLRPAVTISFLTLAFGKLWFVFNLRRPGSALFDNDIFKNPYIAGSIALCILLLFAAVYLPGLSNVLKIENPTGHGWLVILGMSLIPFIFGQVLRIIQRSWVKAR